MGRAITKEEVNLLNDEMMKIVKANYPLKRKKYTIEEMYDYYKELGYIDKLGTLKYRKESVNVYECDGYRNYMYSYMVPSTGYLKDFKIRLYYPGFIVQFPRSERNGEIPEFVDEPKFLKTLSQAQKWSKQTGSENIYEINGPHFKKTTYKLVDDTIYFEGLTNEEKQVFEIAKYKFNKIVYLDYSFFKFSLSSF